MSGVVITIAQTKGGAGKTTLAAHLAVGWTAAQKSVALIDTDPQGSLSRWHRIREERFGAGGTGLDFAAVTGWRAAGEAGRQARSHDIVLIDSPAGGSSSDVRAAMRSSHLVLVPVQPSPMDVWATMSTLQWAEEERIPTLLVLNRVLSRAILTGTMRRWLADYEVGLASTAIGNRVDLAGALADGFGIAESACYSPAAREIASLGEEVLSILPS